MDNKRRTPPRPAPSSKSRREEVDSGNFVGFFQHRIAPMLDELEAERKSIVRRISFWLMLILPIGGALSWFLWHVDEIGFFDGLMISLFKNLAPIFTLGLALLVVARLRGPFDQELNACVIQPLIACFDPSLEYKFDGQVPVSVFSASRLFPGKPPQRYSGAHLVSGTLGSTRMCFSEVEAQRVEKSYGNVGDKEKTYSIFQGVFFNADFNKNFSGSTVVLPDTAEKLFGSIGQILQSWETDFGQLVKLEDPEFERSFVVYSSNQIEARYILTPALMRRILDFQQRSGKEFRMSFAGSSVNVAIKMGKSLFSLPLFRTLLDRRLYEEFWNDLSLLTGIVDELNLNTRIWTKA